MDHVIELDNVSYSYGKNTALHDVTGAFRAGSLTSIAGPNGAGKSTLLKIIAGVLKPNVGAVRLDKSVRGNIGYLPQYAGIDRYYPLTVMQAVCAGFWGSVGSRKSLSSFHRGQAAQALAQVGLAGMEDRALSELSGGQFQRMLFARLMLQDPSVILLDEPFAAIDAETTAKLMGVLLDWHAKGRTIICVLHDLMLIRKYFPESFLLAGKCMGRGHTHQLFEQKLLSFDLDMAELVDPKDACPEHGLSCDCQRKEG